MWVLPSWGTDTNNHGGVEINANGGGRGGGIRPPSSRCCACHAADLLARDASCGNLRTPLHKAMVGGWPLLVQLLVCALRCRGVLREAMRARDALGHTPLELARGYALMPPDKAETERALVWR